MISVLVGEFCIYIHDFPSICKVMFPGDFRVGQKHVAHLDFKEFFGLAYALRFSLSPFVIRDGRACLDHSMVCDNKLVLVCTLLCLADGLFSYMNLPASL